MSNNNFLVEPDAYYIVDGVKHYSKTTAIDAAKGVLGNIKFYFQEHAWDSVNFTPEPPESTDELMRQRAQQLREKYNYLALWYSSGYDSYTTLRAFVDNRIPLDEIMMIDKNKLYHEPEHEYALQHAYYVKRNYFPNMKINVVKLDNDYLIKFYNKEKLNWINLIGRYTRFQKTTKYYCLQYNDDVIKSMDHFDTRGDIIGYEKPKVYTWDNKWFTFSTDSYFEEVIGTKIEPFFQSKDFPQLHVKQVHNVINFFESLPEFSDDLVHVIQGRNRIRNGPYTKYYKAWNLAMGRRELIWHHDFSKYGDQKFYYSESTPLVSDDNKRLVEYFSKHEPEVFKIYMDGINEIHRINTQVDPNVDLNPTLISKAYYVRDFSKSLLTRLKAI